MIIEARNGVVSLSGTLEKNHWPAIQATANLLLRVYPNGILIDASQIAICTQEGARTLFDAMEYIERHQARIVVCQVPEEVQETLRNIPGLRSRIAIAETCDQGRASLDLATDIRRRMPEIVAFSENASVRPRLVMIPLTEDMVGLKEAIGLAIQVGAVVLPGQEGKGSRVAPLIHFLYVLEIPRAMSLNSPLTEEEGRAKEILEKATGYAEKAEIVCQSSVARTRDAGEEIAARSTELGVEILVMSLPRENAPARERLEPIVDAVLQRARCEVLIKNWPA